MTSTYFEDLDSLLDDMDVADFEERRRARRTPPVRTPSRQSSFLQRTGPSAASQGQVQAAARNLDTKIETLTSAVKALETRTNTIAGEQDRVGVALRKEVAERKRSADAVRADLQQTKTLSVLLPMLTQQTVDATDANGRAVRVVTQSQNQLASILPFLLLMQPASAGDAAKGPLGDSTMTLMLALLLNKG
jgi:cysteinyl-tRNA synthetase